MRAGAIRAARAALAGLLAMPAFADAEPGKHVDLLAPGEAAWVEFDARRWRFSDGLLDCQHYTRPEEIDGLRVPEALLGGNHAGIRRWRLKQALGRTWLRRPDLLQAAGLDAERQALLEEFIEEYKQS